VQNVSDWKIDWNLPEMVLSTSDNRLDAIELKTGKRMSSRNDCSFNDLILTEIGVNIRLLLNIDLVLNENEYVVDYRRVDRV